MLRKLKKEPIFEFEDVVYIRPEKKVSVIDEIILKGKFGKRDANKIIKEADIYYKSDVDKVINKIEEGILIGAKEKKVLDYLREELLLMVQETIIDSIKHKGNITQDQVDIIVAEFENSPAEERAEVLKNIEAVLLITTNKTKLKKVKPYQDLIKRLS